MYFQSSIQTFGVLTFLVAFFCGAAVATGQSSCVTDDEVNTMTSKITSGQSGPVDAKLTKLLLDLQKKNRDAFAEAVRANYKGEKWKERIAKNKETTSAQLCKILKTNGWPTSSIVGVEGAAAAFNLLKTTAPLELQMQLLPVIAAAVEKKEIEKGAFAGLVDRLRVNLGNKQLFGTLASISDGFIVLYPIEDEEHVDFRRKQYGLPPLDQQLRTLEKSNNLPLVKTPAAPLGTSAGNLKASVPIAIIPNPSEPETVNEDDIVRVDTNFVSLDVSVYSQKLKSFVGSLGQSDFKIFEDGHEEQITTFAATDVPFDLVLLLDLSGSTLDKRDLIRESTKRFINAARPSDRLALVTFSDTVQVISPLTLDRQKLLEAVESISGKGGSNIWDALKFTMDKVLVRGKLDRRKAIVMMTDGADGALTFTGFGSTISFANLVEAVRASDTLVIPVYLYNSARFRSPFGERLDENSENTLHLLATESGGMYYRAHKVEDLNGVYEQVLNDLGKIYTLGYKPTNNERDGSWRTVVIKVPNRADLAARTRSGYYAK
jgi:VWFA-related protein